MSRAQVSVARSKSRQALSRRHFLQSTAVLGSPLVLPRESHAAGTSLEGYTDAPSVAQGGSIVFYLRDPQALGNGTTVYPLTITRTAQPDAYVTSTQVAIGNQVVPADASTQGCRWAPSYTLSVPASWPSGLYYAYIGRGANACTVPFVVRPATATPGVKTLVMIPVTTVHAYNAYGGKSIYDFNSSGGVRASQVSLDRPFTEAFNAFFDTWSQYLVRWLTKNNLAADFCTDIDIEANPSLLAPYQLYLQAGHDEYWSLGRRNTMDAFAARGGNAAYLGGNTMWFQARLAANAGGVPRRTLVCYKDAAADPITDPAQKTINWISLNPPRPENITTGLGFLYGCSWVEATPARPDTPQVVMRPEHWLYADTGLAHGASFGGAYVGYECDCALFVRGAADQKPYPTGADGTPATLRILAQADGSNWNAQSLGAGGSGEQSGYAQLAIFSNGGTAGTVFNAGSNDWTYGLRPELDGLTPTPISRIMLNLVNRLSQPWTESADVRQFHKVVSGTLWNTYYTVGTAAPADSGMTLDGWVFRAFPLPVAGSVPVYRYRSAVPGSTGTRYRFSRSNTLDVAGVAWVLEGVAFHGFSAARADATAVYEYAATNAALQETSYVYATSATPPAGYVAGPAVWWAPLDNGAVVTPGFQLAAAAASVTVRQGQSASDAITVTPSNGFNGTVTFGASGVPSGVTATFTPAGSSAGTTLVLAVGSAAVPGTYALTVQGTSGSAAPATLPLTLVVTAAPQASFTLSASPSALRLTFGGLLGGSTRISVVAANGFTGTVAFSVSGLPSGLAASFSPASSGSATTLTLQRSGLFGVAPGTYALTVRGTAGALSTSVVLMVVVSLLF